MTDTSTNQGQADSARQGRRRSPSPPLFTMVVERHGDEIFRFACQLTGNRTDAEDLYQETLIKAFRAFERLPADANHRAWL